MLPLQARCHLSLRAVRHAGDTPQARDQLSIAVDMLSRVQMDRWLAAARALLTAVS
jgi:hypothetical protein